MQIEKMMMDRDLHEYLFNLDHFDYVDHIDQKSMIKRYDDQGNDKGQKPARQSFQSCLLPPNHLAFDELANLKLTRTSRDVIML